MSCVWVTLCCNSANADLWEWLNPELGRLRGEVERIRSVLQERRDGYGAMTIGVTASELGAQIHMTTEPPTVPFWLQLEFAESRDFDCVAVIPAVSGINTGDGATYAFPKAFRVDASDDKYFTTFQPIANFSNTDLEAKRSLPFVMRIPKTKAKYIRITILELAEVANRWTYALGEVIVLDGNRNIAMESNVEIGLTPRIPFKWHPRYLLDGRTPLGEMIELDLPEFDGVYCAPEKEGDPNWMMLDLREIFGIQEIRLQPIHARQGASLPGFGFPKRLRVDVFKDESLTDGYCVFNSGDELFSNPGVNLVTFVADNVKGRFVKVTCLETSDSDPKRFGLSEIQVYSGGQNVALQATASIPGK